MRGFEAAMESINIVSEHLNDWVQLQDVFTGRPFWQNSQTGQISMERPGFEHYLPITFRVPSPPTNLPAGISLMTSSEEDEDYGGTQKAADFEKVDRTAMSDKGIQIEDAIRVSDSDDEEPSEGPLRRSSSHFQERSISSPLTTTNLTEQKTGNYASKINSSNYSMPTVTTAKTFQESFFASFRKYQGESFRGVGEYSSEFGSLYDFHAPQSDASLKSEQEFRETVPGSTCSNHEVDERVLVMRKRIDAAIEFKNSKEYRLFSSLKGKNIEVGAVPNAAVIAELKVINESSAGTERALAERIVAKVYLYFSAQHI